MKSKRNTQNCTEMRTWMTCAIAMAMILSAGLLTSCTTASYGNTFVANSQMPDQYSFKIYVGGLQFAPPNSQAEKRIKEYMVGKDYSSYEIIKRRYNLIPSYYEFTVKFSR